MRASATAPAPVAAAEGALGITALGVSKRFGGVAALNEVTVQIAPGSIHGLVGENGAGKSTLGKVLAGVHRPDAGCVELGGREVTFDSPREAIAHGVTIVEQELSLVPARSVVENVFLGSPAQRFGIASSKVDARRYQELVDRIGFDIPPDVPVGTLRVADQQKVEIMRAVARKARLIVMDEPTASLTTAEAQVLFATMRNLRDAGTTIVFVSHFLDEVLALVDDVTVLRDGRWIQTTRAESETKSSLITAMLGRKLDVGFPAKTAPPADAPVVCEVRNLKRLPAVADVSFDVRAGEIVGLSGLVGAGRTEAARIIFGADRRDAGTVHLHGESVDFSHPSDAIEHGIAMVPESRKAEGLVMQRPITDNVILAHPGEISRAGVIQSARVERKLDELIKRLDVRALDPKTPVTNLSGGNQQKVLFAKWLARRPALLILDEPTRGIDVGAKQAIYQLIGELAEEGLAVLMISSEMEEIIGMSHRVVVLREGRVVGTFDGEHLTDDRLLQAAFGHNPTQSGAHA
jgi:ABC-type sugar transport system ATPase subunit